MGYTFFIVATILTLGFVSSHRYGPVTTPKPSCAPGCQNGGQCVSGTCKCPDGFQGGLCEIETCKRFTIKYVQTGQCVSVNKQNNLFISDQCNTLFFLTKEGKLMDVKGKRCFNGPAFNFRFNFLVSVSCNNPGTNYVTTKGGSIKQVFTGTCINLFVGILTVLDTVCDTPATKFAFEQAKCATTNPCENGGTCVQGKDKYTCKCKAGFTGCNCETNIDDCASNPCKNRGTCIDGINSFTCKCVPGFTGKQCETDINECASNPCGYRGTCVDCVNEFKCVCHPGYTGLTCQKRVKCPYGRSGPRCECRYRCYSYDNSFRPTCSSDGRMFRNKCSFRKYKCFYPYVKEVSCHSSGSYSRRNPSPHKY